MSRISAQLQEQVVAVTSPSDLLALVGTMIVLAKVVADTGTQLNCSTLEVRSLNHSRGQLGSRGSSPPHFCPSDIAMGCQMAGLSRVQMSSLLVPFSSCVCRGEWRRQDAGNTWEAGENRKGCGDRSSEVFMCVQTCGLDLNPPRPTHKVPA